MLGRMHEFQTGCVKKGCAFGRTFRTEDAATFPAVLELIKRDEFGKMEIKFGLTCLRSKMENRLRHRKVSQQAAWESG